MWASLVLAAVAAATAPQYGVVVDAGSSHSGVTVFSWGNRVFRAPGEVTLPVAQKGSIFSKTPGISTFGTDVAGLKDYFEPIFRFVDSAVPVPRKNINFYLFATAGMRIIPADQRDAVIAEIRLLVKAAGFPMTDDRIRVLAGEEEGAYGWLAANYLVGTLGRSGPETVGALDLGGASTQITFAPESNVIANFFPIKLSPALHTNVYTHSFLYYGVDQMEARVAARTVPTGAARASSPCYNSGLTRQVVDATGRAVNLTGTGDFAACRRAAAQAMALNTTCLTAPVHHPASTATCSMAGVYQPDLGAGDFLAFSAYAFNVDFFGLPERTSIAAIEAAATKLCATPFDTVVRDHPSVKPKYLETYCYSASYIVALLRDGYGFPANTSRIRFTPSVSGVDLGWALGAIIWEANLLPYINPSASAGSKAYAIAFWVAVPILVVALAAAVLAAAHAQRKREVRAEAYSSGFEGNGLL